MAEWGSVLRHRAVAISMVFVMALGALCFCAPNAVASEVDDVVAEETNVEDALLDEAVIAEIDLDADDSAFLEDKVIEANDADESADAIDGEPDETAEVAEAADAVAGPVEEIDIALEVPTWIEASTSDGWKFGGYAAGTEWSVEEYIGPETTLYIPEAYGGRTVTDIGGEYAIPATVKTLFIPSSITSFGAGTKFVFANMKPGSVIIVSNAAQYAFLTGVQAGDAGNYLFSGYPYDPTGATTPIVKMIDEFIDPAAGPGEGYQFEDVDPNAWYMTEGWIDYVTGKGLMSGYSGVNKFGPDDNITRGQVCTIIFRYFNPGSKATTDPSCYSPSSAYFSDVPSDYYTAAIDWCYEQQIVTGYKDADGNIIGFGPEDNVTREQLAAMMGRFAGPNSISDILVDEVRAKPEGDKISNWAIYDMAWCYSLGIITGYAPTGRLDPQGLATRAQMAKIIALTTQAYEGALAG